MQSIIDLLRTIGGYEAVFDSPLSVMDKHDELFDSARRADLDRKYWAAFGRHFHWDRPHDEFEYIGLSFMNELREVKRRLYEMLARKS